MSEVVAGMSEQQKTGVRVFPSTHWSRVYLACDRERDEGLQALAELLQSYRPALHQYLSHRYSVPCQEVEDWISSFIEKKILERNFLCSAHQDRGRFRSYICTALYNFVESQRRSANSIRRKPPGGIVSCEAAIEEAAHPDNNQPNPGDLRWACEVIDKARKRTEAFYQQKGREQAWTLFLEGCYLPLYCGQKRPSDAELARRHGLETARQAANTITNGKRRFGSFLRKVVREYEDSEGSVDTEIRDLIALVSSGRSR